MTRRRFVVPMIIITAALTVSGCGWTVRATDPTYVPVASWVHPVLSGNGRYLVYYSANEAGLGRGLFLRDLQTGTTELISIATNKDEICDDQDVCYGGPANDWSGEPAITPDGRYVAFSSDADNLVPNDTNYSEDVFVRDRVAQTTTRVSLTTAGAEVTDDSYEPSISADGMKVVFNSDSDDLSPFDTNYSEDGYLHDMVSNKTSRVTVTGGGVELWDGGYESVISGDGNWVAFTSDTDFRADDDNWSSDVFVRSLTNGAVSRVTYPLVTDPEGGGGEKPSISSNGRYVTFQTDATDIDALNDTNGATDVFVRDMVTSATKRVSVTNAAGIVDGASSDGVISGDGSRVAFLSKGNASGTDTNGTFMDVFVRDLSQQRTILAGTKDFGSQLNVDSAQPSISDDGRYIAWRSPGAITADDTNALPDAFVREIDIPNGTGLTGGPIPRGTSVAVTIHGTGFAPGAVLGLPAGVTNGPITVTPTSLATTLTVAPSVLPGTYSISIYNLGTATGPGGGAGAFGLCANCLTVT